MLCYIANLGKCWSTAEWCVTRSPSIPVVTGRFFTLLSQKSQMYTLLVSVAQLYISLFLLPGLPLNLPLDNQVCAPTPSLSVSYSQTYLGSLPLFGSLYDGDYPLPPVQGIPDWFFSYRDRTSHDGNLSGDHREFSGRTPDSVSPSIFTFSADRSPTQSNRSDICYDKTF